MDEKFRAFEMWYLERKDIWAKQGIYVEMSGLSKVAHQYWIKLYSENGFGNIVLYESNGYYWVDFECANHCLGQIFCKGDISFEHGSDLFHYEQEFIIYMSLKEREKTERQNKSCFIVNDILAL